MVTNKTVPEKGITASLCLRLKKGYRDENKETKRENEREKVV